MVFEEGKTNKKLNPCSRCYLVTSLPTSVEDLDGLSSFPALQSLDNQPPAEAPQPPPPTHFSINAAT